MASDQNSILEATHLYKKFGKFTAVENFNLLLSAGEIFGILGPNGAGKTTIIRMLLGLIKATAGEIEINGFSITNNFLNAISNIGNLVEVPSFYNYLSGRKNLELFFNLTDSNLSPKNEIDWALEKVKLLHRANDTVKKYSQGMRQRLGIAAAILNKPSLVILDEPTNGLDPEGMIEIRELIKSLARENKMTFLISSHLLFEIEKLCDRIVILNNGKTIALGNVSELIQPGDENLESLFLRLINQ